MTEVSEVPAGNEPHMVQFNRTAMWVSLALALALVAAVLGGAKVFFDRVARQPVPLATLPSPMADSAECAALLGALPERLAGHARAELADPAPAGAAAWQSSSAERITLRCGVDAPLQYNEYTPTFEAAGARWMRIDDSTPGSTMSTWYTVDRAPVVAVTSDDAAVGGREFARDLGSLPIGDLPQEEVPPAPAPLSELAAGPRAGCDALMSELPASIAEGFSPIDATEPLTAVWVKEGKEPIVVRCGVADPENYEAGIQLYQINEVTWFEDTTLANGTTSSTWFALGRDAVVAASLPQAEGNEAVTALSEAIARSVPETS
ncbi:DUF3515 domain-containing protein [Corynebacterium sp.]|uniref:DUF3515 domain-containing protein n=1 Tax=Corynebacterium sp. TaxID=1720 RepID=UPI002A916C78|nr:DUF3515 domain-containing protein [Corynebacterium sp.]MDY5784928.1 DUF3515 domain-containing protein [Corynebacterium sp.]